MSVIMLKTDSSPISALILEHMEGLIRATDTKAQLTLAANTLLAAAVSISDRGITPQFPQVVTLKDAVIAIASLLLLGCLIISFYYALRTIRPSLVVRGQEFESLFYFGYINSLSRDEFVDVFSSQTGPAIQAALLEQVHAKSQLVERKFSYIRNAVNTLFFALVLWTIIQIVLIFFA